MEERGKDQHFGSHIVAEKIMRAEMKSYGNVKA